MQTKQNMSRQRQSILHYINEIMVTRNGYRILVIEMYSTHIEGKSIIAERFIRLLKKEFINI